MKKKFKFAIFISSLLALTTAATVLSTVAWFIGAPKIETAIDSNIKNIAGYFDSNTADDNGETEGNGDGTVENPFVISRPNHLHNLMRLYNDTASSGAYNLLNGKYIEIGKNLDGSSTKKVYDYTDTGEIVPNSYSTTLNMAMYKDSFRPIGYATSCGFKSIIKGNGLTIDHLTISKGGKSGSFSYFGFIGYAESNASVENLNFDNLVIEAGTASTWVGFYAGSSANSSTFTNCKVRKADVQNKTTTIQSKFGYYGTIRSGVSSDGGKADSLSMASSDITNSTTNLFDEIQHDHIATRTDYSQTSGTIDINTPFSSGIGADGTLKDGYSLSTVGHVESTTSQVKYGSSPSSLTPFDASATQVDTAPNGSSPDGHYFYSENGDYKYSIVESQSAPAATWNTFIISGKNPNSNTTYYLYVDSDDMLQATTTAPGSYSSTPNYYFSLIKTSGTPNGVSEITTSQMIVKLYSPSIGKYAFAFSSSYKFFYNSGYHGDPKAFGFRPGTTKTCMGLSINSTGGIVTSGDTIFSFTADNGDTPIFNRRANEGPSIAATVTDTLTASKFTATSTSYTAFSNVKASSDAIYAGKSAKNNAGSIQLRSSGSDCGIVQTKSGGNVKSVTVTWDTSTSSGRTLDIYGKNSAYSSAADLYNSSNQGTKIGSIVYGTSTTLSISTDYAYIGIRSNSSALYLKSISIEFKESTIPVTGVTMNPTTATMSVGGSTTTLTATVAPSNATNKNVSWSSNDTSVATVNNGVVTAVGAGTATITVTTQDGGKTATCVVTVYAAATLDKLRIKKEPKKIFTKGDTVTTDGLVVEGYITSLGTSNWVELTSSQYKITLPSTGQVGNFDVVIENNASTTSWPGTSAGTVTTFYTIEVVNPATLTLSGDDSVTHYASASLSLAAADIDGNVVWSLTDSSKGTLSNTSNSGATFIADKVSSGSATVRARAKNVAGDYVETAKTITINPLGVASVAFTEPLKTSGITLNEGESYDTPLTSSLSFTSTDGVHQPDNKNVTFSLTDLDPVGGGFATINASTGTITTSGSGTATIVVTTADGGYTDTISLEVVALSGDPTITEDPDNEYEYYLNDEEANFYGTCENTTSIAWDLIDPDNITTHPEDLSDPTNGDVMVAFEITKQGEYTLVCHPSNSARQGESTTYKFYGLDLDDLSVSGATNAFQVGDSFNYSGLQVTANYSDGGTHTRNIPVTSGYTVTPPASLVSNNVCASAGTANVTVSYTDSRHLSGQGTYPITITNVDVTSFDVEVSGNGIETKTGVTSLTLLTGDAKTFSITNILPANATTPLTKSWSTTDSSIVSISAASGDSITITPEAAGNATVTATVAAVGQSVSPHTPISYSISITVIESISASQHYEDAIEYTGEARVTTSNVYWSKDNGNTWEILCNIQDPNPSFYKVGGLWYVTVGEYQEPSEGWTDYELVTNASQINDGDYVIMLNSDISPTSGEVNPQKNVNAYINYDETEWSQGSSKCEYTLTYSDQFEIVNNKISESVVSESSAIEFQVTKNTSDSSYSFSYPYDENTDYYLAASSSNNMEYVSSITNYSKFTLDVDSNGGSTLRALGRESREKVYINQQRNTYGALGTYTPGSGDKQYAKMRLFVCHYNEVPGKGKIDFIGDNVINSSGINPITRGQTSSNACRFDIIGSNNGPRMSETSIAISNPATVSYSASSSISGSLNPIVNLKNTILMYIPKNPSNVDLGTIHINYDTVGSAAPKIIKKDGSLISASNFVNSDVGLNSGNMYLSLSTLNINDIAYAKVNSSGNIVSSGEAFYVIALTAPANGTTLFKNVEFQRAGSVTGNNNTFSATSSAVPFTFAYNSNAINSLSFVYNETRKEFRIIVDQKASSSVTYGLVNYNAQNYSILFSSNNGVNYTPIMYGVWNHTINT